MRGHDCSKKHYCAQQDVVWAVLVALRRDSFHSSPTPQLHFRLIPDHRGSIRNLLVPYFFKSSSASLSFVPLFSLSLGCNLGSPSEAAPPAPAETLFLAASLRRSESSLRRSSVLSLPSSSSPSANGSLSSSGWGATDVSDCHFLLLFLSAPAPELLAASLRSKASTSSTGPDCGGLGCGLKRSGLVGLRLLVRGGWAGAVRWVRKLSGTEGRG